MFTENRINISQKVENGETLFFANEIKAYNYAEQVRSYHYQVFDKNGRHAGYAVPK